MKKTIIRLIILVLIASACGQADKQTKTVNKQKEAVNNEDCVENGTRLPYLYEEDILAIEMLKEFYTQYITENAKTASDFDLKKVKAIENKYFSQKLIQKLKTAELEADPFLNAQDFELAWIENLEITPFVTENVYKVCYNYTQEHTKCITLVLTKENEKYLIDDIENETVYEEQYDSEKNLPEVFNEILGDDVIFATTFGDLNGDGEEDCVILTRQTKEEAFGKRSNGDTYDANRRGIAIAFKKGDGYELRLVMPGCFISEMESNRDCLNYVSAEIQNGNLHINWHIDYKPGECGNSDDYTFRFQNNRFELVDYEGRSARYEHENDKWFLVPNSQTNIDFRTGKMQLKTYGNNNVSKLQLDLEMQKPIELSDLKIFDRDINGEKNISYCIVQTNRITNEALERQFENFARCIVSGEYEKSLEYFNSEYVKKQHDDFMDGHTDQFLREFFHVDALADIKSMQIKLNPLSAEPEGIFEIELKSGEIQYAKWTFSIDKTNKIYFIGGWG